VNERTQLLGNSSENVDYNIADMDQRTRLLYNTQRIHNMNSRFEDTQRLAEEAGNFINNIFLFSKKNIYYIIVSFIKNIIYLKYLLTIIIKINYYFILILLCKYYKIIIYHLNNVEAMGSDTLQLLHEQRQQLLGINNNVYFNYNISIF